MKLNKHKTYSADITSVLDVKLNPNYSITNKLWFQQSELATQIKQETEWVDTLNPDFTLNQRIILIRDNILDFKECLICNSKIKYKQRIDKTSNYCSRSCSTKSSVQERVASRRENSKDKRCISKKLLKYPLECYDYTKINNKAYNKQKHTTLLINYLWFEYKNLDLVTKALIKYSKQRIFNIIQTDLSFLIPEFEKEYQLEFDTPDKHRILKFEKEPRLCPECGNRVLTDNQFCSVKCSNQFKTTDENYITNLSNGVKYYYKTANIDVIKQRHDKIKYTLYDFNSNLTPEERKEKYSNKELIYDSFENRQEQFNHLTFLFDKEFYYANKNLPVKCNSCGFEWDMTKSTSINRIACRKCNPFKKGKTQSEIFDYMYQFAFCKTNDKSFLNDLKELDILCPEYRLAVEYDGLLYHSCGISKYPIFHKPIIDINYHLRKTEECREKGFKLLHIFENEWNDPIKNNIWKSIIKYNIGIIEEYGDYIIKEIDKEISNIFLDKTHLKGKSIESEIFIGAYSNNELISVLSFKYLSINKYEITRFCSYSSDEIEKKILQYFEEHYSPDLLLYCSDRRYEDPEKFINLGFNFIENTHPNCFKFNVNENILEECDYENYVLIETERIIFDCGNAIFKKIY